MFRASASSSAIVCSAAVTTFDCGAFEMALSQLGHDVELGAGVAAAQRVFLEAGVPAATPA